MESQGEEEEQLNLMFVYEDGGVEEAGALGG